MSLLLIVACFDILKLALSLRSKIQLVDSKKYLLPLGPIAPISISSSSKIMFVLAVRMGLRLDAFIMSKGFELGSPAAVFYQL